MSLRKQGLLVGLGASAFLMLDGPFSRRLLSMQIWAPTALLALFASQSKVSLLEILSAHLRWTTGDWGPLRLVLGNLAGLLLLRETISVALSVKRAILVEGGDLLLTPSSYPNSRTASWGKMSKALSKLATTLAMDLGSRVPGISHMIRKEIKKEVDKMEADFRKTLRPDSRDACHEMPERGIAAAEISAMMNAVAQEEDRKWADGYVSGAVYHGEADHLQLLNDAYASFSVSNPLHPDIWPSGMKFEAEVISWVANLMRGGDPDVCGSLTSGGTESIVLAAKAHRDRARSVLGVGERSPEIIACVSAHAAIDKACDLMGIRLIKVPMTESYQVDIAAVRRAISADTIMIYSSAPSFPQGVIDPIDKLSSICVQRGIGLHVDCCLGGFILPFMTEAGFGDGLPAFDFSLPGVTSMSVDTHKYGYASKGTSVVLYRHRELRKYQYFAYPDWTGGLYVTPTIAGSRPGGLTAACWASLASIGHEGFVARTRDIVATARRVAEGVAQIRGLRLMLPRGCHAPQAMIVCFDGEPSGPFKVDCLRVSDAMAKKNWSLNALQNPNCVHLCCTIRTIGREARFLADLEAAVHEVRAAAAASPAEEEGSTAAIYGMASGMPAGPVKELMYTYTDVKYVV